MTALPLTKADMSTQGLTECIVLWLEANGVKSEDITVEALVGCFSIVGAKYDIDVWHSDSISLQLSGVKVTSLKYPRDRVWGMDDVIDFDYCSPGFFDSLAKHLELEGI